MRSFHSAFISYGGLDEGKTKCLYRALLSNDIDLFFFPESAIPGKKLHRTMSEGVKEYDKVILICSETSLKRNGVLNEIELVLTKEAGLGGAEILIPIALDNYVHTGWEPDRKDLAEQVRNRVIADFIDLEMRDGSTLKTEPGFQRILRRL